MRSGRSAAAERRPMYARVLGLRHLELGGLACFLLFEGSLTLGALLALAELANWWTVVALPVTVAAMVKFNDTVAGSLRPARMSFRAVAAVASAVVGRPAVGRARVVPAQVHRVRAATGTGTARATASVPVPGLVRSGVPGGRRAGGPGTGTAYLGGTYTHGSSAGAGAVGAGAVFHDGAPTGTGSGPGTVYGGHPAGRASAESAREPARGGARHRVGRQRGERVDDEFHGHAARHSASRRYR